MKDSGTESGLQGWFRGNRWAGHRPFVLVAWIVTILLLALCVFTMVGSGHTTPFFNF